MGIFSSFTCPVCNRNLSWTQKTSTQINGEFLCGECAKKRFFDLANISKNKEDLELKQTEFDNNIIKNREELKERESLFNPTMSIGEYIIFDDKNKMFSFPKGNRKTNVGTIIKYEELLNFEIIEDGETITKGGLGKALVGGALFGLAGTIAGGTSKKSKQLCTDLKLKITTRNSQSPIIFINFLDYEIRKDSFLYKQISNNIQEILSKFQLIIDEYDINNRNSISSTISIPDEIKKYKELLDMGAITQEEFEEKKRQLLNM